MTAGSIAVPTIVPLRVPSSGKSKNHIDTSTPIELKTGEYYQHSHNYLTTNIYIYDFLFIIQQKKETPNAEIFFTIDGSKPDPFAALGVDRSTIKYTKPFKLREGRKTVKAVALSRHDICQTCQFKITICLIYVYSIQRRHEGKSYRDEMF